MNNYGSVENFCRELQKKIASLRRLQDLGLPQQERESLNTAASTLQDVYFDLVDSDLYRR